MRRFLLAIVAVISLATPTLAQTQDSGREARLALAERVIAAAQADQLAQQALAISDAFTPDDMAGLNARERAAMVEVRDEVTRNMMARMTDGMLELFADLYTQEELEAMVAFYESPVGRSITAKSMQATPQIIELTRSLLPDMARDMANGLCDRLDCTPDERRELLRGMLSGMGLQES